MIAAQCPHELGEGAIRDRGQVGGRMPRFSFAAMSAFDERDLHAGRLQKIGGGDAGDTATHHHDVDRQIVRQRRIGWPDTRLRPIRRGVERQR
jgi:hypothetical protein